MTYRECVECGADLKGKRCGAKHCSVKCRMKAMRRRQASIQVFRACAKEGVNKRPQ